MWLEHKAVIGAPNCDELNVCHTTFWIIQAYPTPDTGESDAYTTIHNLAYTAVRLVTLECTHRVIDPLYHCRHSARDRRYECGCGIS